MLRDQARILVIDDDEVIAGLICDILSTDDCTVDMACDPYQGLELIRTHHYDLVILDLGLPQIDGVEVVRRIRAEPAIAETPILIVSAYHELWKRVPHDQVSGFLAKPFSVDLLGERVAKILDSSGRNANSFASR